MSSNNNTYLPGPHHKRMSLEERQSSLQGQYFFTCDCTACKTEKGQKKKVAVCIIEDHAGHSPCYLWRSQPDILVQCSPYSITVYFKATYCKTANFWSHCVTLFAIKPLYKICNIRPHFHGPMGDLKINGPPYRLETPCTPSNLEPHFAIASGF